MAIDIRATVTCSLGTLISGSVSDDYLQGSGLVKTRGSCEISGLITPAMGTVVTFSYTKGGVTRSIPRKLRVLSSFADPFRRTTKVELGCKLTYLSDLQESIKWSASDDPENEDFTEEDERIITLPISASSVMAECLSKLNIAASNIPLTNRFSIGEFDFSSGYVQVLSNLLVSESYFGYLDSNEVLQVRSLSQGVTTGPVLTAADIVDVGPIGVGQLPGEAVTVSYSSLKLRSPEITTSSDPESEGYEEIQEAIQRINWEYDDAIGSEQFYFISYKERLSQTDELKLAVYSGSSLSTTFTGYGLIQIRNPETGELEDKEVVTHRFTKNYGPSISVATPFAQAILENSRFIARGVDETVSFNNVWVQLSGTNTFYEYSKNGETIVTTEEIFKTEAEQVGSMGIDLAYEFTFGIPPQVGVDVVVSSFNLMLTELVITTTQSSGDAAKQIVTRYKRLSDTQHGQQAIATLRENISNIDEAADAINAGLRGLVFDSSSVESKFSGRTVDELPVRPSPALRINSEYSVDGSSSNDWRAESKAEIELALGSATAQRRIEFSLPYAPDDVFIKIQSGGEGSPVLTSYRSTSSDAPSKAALYGRVQNRLLLGNRSGINLQVAPERMPTAPFDALFVQAAGLTSLYRANGNQWAFDSNGIVCSTDALYWGVAGKNS
jgi:hypothetical protein